MDSDTSDADQPSVHDVVALDNESVPQIMAFRSDIPFQFNALASDLYPIRNVVKAMT